MRKRPIVVGIAVLLVAVSAGVAALLLNGPDGPTPVSAAEACNLMDTPYDALMTTTTPIGEIRTVVRYSETDEHVVETITNQEDILLGKYEMILKDRTRYSRESTPGNPEVYAEWRVHGTNDSGSVSLPCLNPVSFEEGAPGSSDEPHFTFERFISEGQGAVRIEYWVDSVGRPTRARSTRFPPEYDVVTNTETIVIAFTYSDYGESNVIEAPCAGAALDQADNPALMRDCIRLLAMKDTLRGTATLNWSLDTPITSWDGVTLNGTPSRVSRLLLPSKRLTGSIPSSFGSFFHLTHLTHLNLSGNSLTGNIPPELERLEGLAELRLSGNSLTGCIPLSLKDVATNDLSSLNLLYCHPPKPENLTVGTIGETSVSLSWDAVPNASKYRVQYVPGGGGVLITDDDTITGTTHTVDGLTCESEYRFLVSAYNSGTEYAEAWSEEAWLSETTGECMSPVFEEAEYSFPVAENAEVGRVVGTVEATDPDADTLTFSITEGKRRRQVLHRQEIGEIIVAGSLDDARPRRSIR